MAATAWDESGTLGKIRSRLDECRNEPGNFFGTRGAVSIHHDDDVAGGRRESACQSIPFPPARLLHDRNVRQDLTCDGDCAVI